jgi:thiamine-monophosphate kinase
MKLPPFGEFHLINSILERRPDRGDPAVLLGPGDDASILRFGDSILAVSVDSFKEGRHFSFDYFSPEQVGAKAIQASASDIVAMGGIPKWAWVSIATRVRVDNDRVLKVYDGMYRATESLSMSIEGGETIQDQAGLMISVTVLGEVATPEQVCRRSDATPGDVVCVTGTCGGSAGGLRLLQEGVAGFASLKARHLDPTCRSDLIPALSGTVNAMIDVSDGLSSELWHLATASGVSIEVQTDVIPLPDTLQEAAALLEVDPLLLALNGGEDFELLYTVPTWDESLPGTPIGEVKAGQGVYVKDASENIVPLQAAGYTHGD